ncbi:MAG: CotH kinase family protein [Prevotella sp.]|nr:CotH kinase family protein [Prevotella sp.]
MQKTTLLFLFLLCTGWLYSQPKFSIPHGLYDDAAITVDIMKTDATATVHYTTDGSMPTADSKKYTSPLTFNKTTLLRAVEVKDGISVSSVTTATYIFVASVLEQPNNPEGYPEKWGKYTQRSGTAIADYEMDPEMTGDPALREKIAQGLYTLPILSIVSDKDNFFSHEKNSETGGIYIYTGPPVGDNTGNGWTRQASTELFGGPQQHDFTTDCGVRLHGGHGRLPEKNPKHSFRLVFKKEYGLSKLEYPLFGDSAEFDQLVLRCHFGNSWQHQDPVRRPRGQYTRDVWARRMQRKMGHTAVDALYVHLFLNGMYWGLYNIAERVDEQFGKSHFGGKKSEYDVVKIEEEGGRHLEASEGTLAKWNRMIETVGKASDDTYYYMLQGKDAAGKDDETIEPLLHIESFIDYMIINQYAGNTDWDYHNWYAVAHREDKSKGFRFLCWDSEQIFESSSDNVVPDNEGKNYPTGIFQALLKNDMFANRYLRRAQELLSDGGMLSERSVVQVWDSLYNVVSLAVYDESARWGDYRRDVHRYTSKGELYTVDNHYMKERNRLLTQYFPKRSAKVLKDIQTFIESTTGITGIKEIQAGDNDNGDASYYNLSGQRVLKPASGIYIHKGKKVVVK